MRKFRRCTRAMRPPSPNPPVTGGGEGHRGVRQMVERGASDWLTNDAAFRRECEQGHAWERWVGSYLLLHSLAVRLPEQSIREDVRDATAYRNSADLWVGSIRLEVKSRSETFTSPADFPYHEMFVDTVRKWHARNPKPAAMIVVSRPTGAMVAVSPRSEHRWVVIRRRDGVRGYSDDFYAAPRECWRSVGELVAWLKTRREAK